MSTPAASIERGCPAPARIRDDEPGSGVWRIPAIPPRPSWIGPIVGRRLPTAAAVHQTVSKRVGLAVFSSDALSSTAYATQEILLVLAVAGTAALARAVPISLAIVSLLAVVTVSYWQTIHAYPGGGGAYVVARENLGEVAAQTAGAALLVDYVLTVAVSVSSGVAQLGSAYPSLYEHRVLVSVLLVAGMLLVNLRGVRESGAVFSVPTYFFLGAISFTVIAGIARWVTGGLSLVEAPPPFTFSGDVGPVTLFLLLHAFSNGTTALTGVEAISNGITAFREPKSRNAGITLVWMSAILGALFLGITFLAVRIGAVPSESETVISQLARTVFGAHGFGHALYLATIAATTCILVMAANTAFADFPRLGALHAADGFLPRQLTYRGSRLVYSRGMCVLAAVACLLIIAFRASVTALIPLYAIGVFLSFTLSQLGMARRWWNQRRVLSGGRPRETAWAVKMAVNGFGAVCTGIVVVVFAFTKFREGAWIVVLLVPALVAIFFAIHHHYRDLAGRLSLDRHGAVPTVQRHRVVLLVGGVHRGTLEALRYAKTLSHDITALHVSADAEEAETIRKKWDEWGDGVRLVILDSPYRLLYEPVLAYIEKLAAIREPHETITVLVPQFVPARRWHNLLHTQTAFWLRMRLLARRGIVVTDVPYHVGGMTPPVAV